MKEKIREEPKAVEEQDNQRKKSDDELIAKIREKAEMYRLSASNRLKEEEKEKGGETLQDLVTQETKSMIMLSEAGEELKQQISHNASINTELVNSKVEEREVSSQVAVLESREKELSSLKQTHAAAKAFKEASECVKELNEVVLPELKRLNDALAKKRANVNQLEAVLTKSEARLSEAKEKQREADLACTKSRKLCLESELNSRTDENDLEVKALQAALKLLLLKSA